MERVKVTNTVVKFAGLFFFLVLTSCQKEGEWFGPVHPPVDEAVPISLADRYLIGCEGNFQYGNASLSVFFPDSGQIENQVFERANGFGPGDVLQSMLQVDSLIYLVMNNSGLIRVVHSSDYRELAVLDGLNAPRYAVPLNRNRLVVSSFGGGELSVIDRRTGQLEQTINAAEWTEQLYLLNNRLYVIGKSDSTLIVIDTTSLVNTGAFELGADPIDAGVREEALYVGVQRGSMLRVLRFTDDSFTMTLEYPATVNDLSFTNDGISVLTADSILQFDWSGSLTRSIAHALQTPYSIYSDTSFVIASDVFDYLSNGSVKVYDDRLNLIQEHETGLIPQAILRIQQP